MFMIQYLVLCKLVGIKTSETHVSVAKSHIACMKDMIALMLDAF